LWQDCVHASLVGQTKQFRWADLAKCSPKFADLSPSAEVTCSPKAIFAAAAESPAHPEGKAAGIAASTDVARHWSKSPTLIARGSYEGRRHFYALLNPQRCLMNVVLPSSK